MKHEKQRCTIGDTFDTHDVIKIFNTILLELLYTFYTIYIILSIFYFSLIWLLLASSPTCQLCDSHSIKNITYIHKKGRTSENLTKTRVILPKGKDRERERAKRIYRPHFQGAFFRENIGTHTRKNRERNMNYGW